MIAKTRNLALTILAATVVGCRPAPPAAPAPSAAAEHRVTIHGHKFQPTELVVPSGTEVTWVNRDLVHHTVTSSGAVVEFDSGEIPMQTTYSRTFTKVGAYPYHVHSPSRNAGRDRRGVAITPG